MEIDFNEDFTSFDKIEAILKTSLSEKGFKLWTRLIKKLPNIWGRLSSSSKKYHKKADGSVPSIGEHTIEMLNAAVKTKSMWGFDKNKDLQDILFLAIGLHDILKYGSKGDLEHTTTKHDKLIGDLINKIKPILHKHYTELEVEMLENLVRFHSGRWSSDLSKDCCLRELDPLVIFVHSLDMLSAADCLKI